MTDLAAEVSRQLAQARLDFGKQTQILQAVMWSISDGVVVANRDGHFLHFNQAAEQILGIGLTDAGVDGWSNQYGCFLPDGVTPYPPHDLPLARAITGETVTEGEIFIRHAGRPQGLWLSVNAAPLRDADGAIIGGVAAFRDITARKRSEEILRQTAADLKRSNEDLQQFAYVVSHDLEQPLRKVSRFCKLLREHCQGRLDSQAEDYLRYAIDSANRLERMIQDLLTYARVGKGKARRVPVDLTATFTEALTDLPAGDASVRIGKLPRVLGDASQLRQLAANLLSNALKFQKGAPQIEVLGVEEEGKLRVGVRDNGIGIEPEALSRIFAVFERAAPEGAYPGTGLGLAICKRIVENHGGRIWAESRPGAGATVWFTLPLVPA